MVVGACTFSELAEQSGMDWLAKGESRYQPDSATTSKLGKALRDYDLIVFLGTWCEDSQDLIPKLQKTLTAVHFPLSRLQMYGVNRAKESKHYDHKAYKIELVPTIIVVKNHAEIGRIVERTTKSIEADLLAIVAPQ